MGKNDNTAADTEELENIHTFLRESGLVKYFDLLVSNGYNSLDAVSRISLEDLSRFGVKALGARRKFLTAVNILRSQLYAVASNGNDFNRKYNSNNDNNQYNNNNNDNFDLLPSNTWDSSFPLQILSHGNLTGGQNNNNSNNSNSGSNQQQQNRKQYSQKNTIITGTNDGSLIDNDVVALRAELERALYRESLLRSDLKAYQAEITTLRQQSIKSEEEAQKLRNDLHLARRDIEAGIQREQEKGTKIQSLMAQIPEDIRSEKFPELVQYCRRESQALKGVAQGLTNILIGKDPVDEEVDEVELQKFYDNLTSENAELEQIKEAADQLLIFEKDENILGKTKDEVIVHRRRSMDVDVDMFRAAISKRLKDWMPAQKAKQNYLLHKLPPANYNKMMKEQMEAMDQLNKSDADYRALVEKCLKRAKDAANLHFEIGEFRDKTEYRLKMQLSNLIGIPTKDEVPDEDLERRNRGDRRIQFSKANDILMQQLEDILRRVDTSGDGLMAWKELSEAVEQDTNLWQELHVLAINLAFCPENRMLSDNKEFNDVYQGMLDRILLSIDPNGDGILSLEELKAMTPSTKQLLLELGIIIKI